MGSSNTKAAAPCGVTLGLAASVVCLLMFWDCLGFGAVTAGRGPSPAGYMSSLRSCKEALCKIEIQRSAKQSVKSEMPSDDNKREDREYPRSVVGRRVCILKKSLFAQQYLECSGESIAYLSMPVYQRHRAQDAISFDTSLDSI